MMMVFMLRGKIPLCLKRVACPPPPSTLDGSDSDMLCECRCPLGEGGGHLNILYEYIENYIKIWTPLPFVACTVKLRENFLYLKEFETLNRND